MTEDLAHKESDIKRKLYQIEERRKAEGIVDLRDIEKPEEITLGMEVAREAALKRNAKFIQDLTIEAGRLHTKGLLPVNAKLEELKKKAFIDY